MGEVIPWLVRTSSFGMVDPERKTGLFKKIPEAAPQPMPEAPAMKDMADEATKAIGKRRRSTTQSIYTSPLGIGGAAQVARKTLLGM